MESVEIRKLFIHLKNLEKDLGSISPKVVSVHERIKKEISETQERINKLRKLEGTPLNRQR